MGAVSRDSLVRQNGAEEDVAWQPLEQTKCLFNVLRDCPLLPAADERVAGVHVRTADDDDVVHLRAPL